MSDIEKILDSLQRAAVGQNLEYTLDAVIAARAELASLRSALTDRDAAIARAVADEREECAVGLESLKQVRIPEPFRKCGFYDHLNEDDDGWRDLSRDEKSLLATAAAAIRARGEGKE